MNDVNEISHRIPDDEWTDTTDLFQMHANTMSDEKATATSTIVIWLVMHRCLFHSLLFCTMNVNPKMKHEFLGFVTLKEFCGKTAQNSPDWGVSKQFIDANERHESGSVFQSMIHLLHLKILTLIQMAIQLHGTPNQNKGTSSIIQTPQNVKAASDLISIYCQNSS